MFHYFISFILFLMASHGVAMIEETQVTAGQLLLQDADYPPNFIHMAHPEDLKESKEPINPEYIRHHKRDHHRLLFRISFIKLESGKFLPLTFVCDTGAPSHFYLSRW
jgi:hypothetical protein